MQNVAITLSKEYKKLQTDYRGKTLAYYYYQDENPKETLLLMSECFAYFENVHGEYPYATYALAQTELCLGGEAYSAFSWVDCHLTQEEKAREIALQTARQWWGMGIGVNRVENAWQDLGLSAYSAICFFEEHEKYGVTREIEVQNALKEYRSYYDVYGSVLGRTDTAMRRHLKAFVNGYEFQCLEVDKAVIMLDTLRKSVGDKQFFLGLKRYYKENVGKMAIPENLVGAFERVGVDASGFFESFLNGKAIL